MDDELTTQAWAHLCESMPQRDSDPLPEHESELVRRNNKRNLSAEYHSAELSRWELHGLKQRDDINSEFSAVFHSAQPSASIRGFLRSNFAGVNSRHLSALLHFCRPETDGLELPGMVYGMIWEAWKQFVDEIYPDPTARN
jgi:hypothetical protein